MAYEKAHDNRPNTSILQTLAESCSSSQWLRVHATPAAIHNKNVLLQHHLVLLAIQFSFGKRQHNIQQNVQDHGGRIDRFYRFTAFINNIPQAKSTKDCLSREFLSLRRECYILSNI